MKDITFEKLILKYRNYTKENTLRKYDLYTENTDGKRDWHTSFSQICNSS